LANENLKYVFSADISGFQNAIKNVNAGLKSTGEKLKNIGSDLSTYVSLPLAALGTAAIKAFGDIQSLKNGLNTVTGSAKETERQFVRLKNIAKLPGLGLEEAVRGSINLQVIGFSAGKAEKAMKALGNAVASVGKGKVEFEGALYGLQQLANTDTPLAEDLNILKERIPQITPLLKAAFGSARSDELAKMGVTSAQLVDTIINGLSKLPPVTGGINTAFENLGDGIKNNLAEVGEIINKNLDISALFDGIVDSLTGVVTWFKSLSPEIQKATLVFAGLAIVIPPLLVGLGALIGTVLPALIAGFAAVVSPVGAVVAAIVAAGVLIYQNWDKVKEYFTSGDGSKFWNTVKGYASDLWESLKSIFNSIKTFALAIWSKIGDNLTSIVGTSFGLLKDIVTSVLGVIVGIVRVFAAVLKGDWSAVWDGVKSVTISLWNGIISIVKSFVKQMGNVLGGFFKLLGMDTIGNGLKNLGDGIDTLFSKIQIPIKTATNAVKDFKKELTGVKDTKVTAETETIAGKPTTKGDSKTKDKINEVYHDLKIGMSQIDNLFGATFDEKQTKRIQEYQNAINDLIKLGIDPASAAIKKLQEQQAKFLQIEVSDRKQKPTTVAAPKFDATPYKSNVKLISEQKMRVLTLMQEMNEGITSSLNSGIANMAGGFTEMVGQMASGTMSMGGVVKGLVGMLADMAVQLGKIAISTGVAMLGIKIAFKNPLTAIAAGVALVALGSAVKGQISKATGGDGKDSGRVAFAKGGIVSGPTNAIVGEYGSASRNNPEVIAPLNSLKGMLGDMGNGFGGDVQFRIEGTQLVGVLRNYDKRQLRTN
jgi:tape measure domain-containing protein